MSPETVLFTATYLLLPFLPFTVVRLAGVRLASVAIPSVFTWYYFCLAYLGILPLYLALSSDYHRLGIVDREVIALMLASTGACWILVCAGILAASRFLGGVPDAPSAGGRRIGRRGAYVFVLATAACVAVLAAYLRLIPGIPVVGAFTQPEMVFKGLRSQATTLFAGPGRFHHYALFFSELLPFLGWTAFAQALRAPGKGWWAASAGIGLLTLFATIMNAEKAPLMWLVMGYSLTFLLTAGHRVSRKQLAAILLSLGAAAVSLLIVFSGMGTMDQILYVPAVLFERIFMGGIAESYFYLLHFPETFGFLEGASFPNPRSLFPWEPFPLTRAIWEATTAGKFPSTIAGSSPTVFWGEMYANFGVLGMFVAAPIVGAVLYAVHLFVRSMPEHPARAALEIWLVLYLVKLCETNLSQYLVDYRPYAVAALAWILYRADAPPSRKAVA